MNTHNIKTNQKLKLYEKTFYRVANTETEQGLWYDFKGQFTGLIHSKDVLVDHRSVVHMIEKIEPMFIL